MDTDGKTAVGDAGREDAAGAELADAIARAAEAKQQHLYALAEIENIKKRSERQIVERVTHARRTMLVKFLPVLDNLERALAFDADAQGLRGGLEATMRSFESLLASEEITAMSVVGAPFDPRTAEAIGTQPSTDVAEDVVLTEVQRGYLIGGDVLRPARVLVSKRPS